VSMVEPSRMNPGQVQNKDKTSVHKSAKKCGVPTPRSKKHHQLGHRADLAPQRHRGKGTDGYRQHGWCHPAAGMERKQCNVSHTEKTPSMPADNEGRVQQERQTPRRVRNKSSRHPPHPYKVKDPKRILQSRPTSWLVNQPKVRRPRGQLDVRGILSPLGRRGDTLV